MGSGMVLIGAYVVCIVFGNLIAWQVGLVVEQRWPVIGLPAFLAMFFGVLILAWPIAVRLTARWDEKPAV